MKQSNVLIKEVAELSTPVFATTEEEALKEANHDDTFSNGEINVFSGGTSIFTDDSLVEFTNENVDLRNFVFKYKLYLEKVKRILYRCFPVKKVNFNYYCPFTSDDGQEFWESNNEAVTHDAFRTWYAQQVMNEYAYFEDALKRELTSNIDEGMWIMVISWVHQHVHFIYDFIDYFPDQFNLGQINDAQNLINYLEESFYWDASTTTIEYCGNCEGEVEIPAYGISTCPDCGESIMPCNRCRPCYTDIDHNCSTDCPWEKGAIK